MPLIAGAIDAKRFDRIDVCVFVGSYADANVEHWSVIWYCHWTMDV